MLIGDRNSHEGCNLALFQPFPSNGNAAECMQAGVESGRILFLGPARELRMRIESSASNITLQKTEQCLRFCVQVCPVFQLMVMKPPTCI